MVELDGRVGRFLNTKVEEAELNGAVSSSAMAAWWIVLNAMVVDDVSFDSGRKWRR